VPIQVPVGRKLNFGALVGAMADVVLIADPDLRLSFVNEAGEALMGWSAEEWIGRSILDLVHPDDIAVAVSSAGTVQGKRAGSPVEVRARTADGGWKWLEIVGADALGVPGVNGLVIVARDLTQRRMWEVAAGETERFQQVMQHASSITLLLDEEGRVGSVNGAFTRLLGHDPSIVIGRTLISFTDEEGGGELAAAIERCIRTGRSVSCEVPMRVVDPQHLPRPIRFEIVNLLDDPVVAGLVVTAHDVSDLHVARRTLEHLARHDALTGLVNRSVLVERLERVVAERLPAAVIFIDLDRFKPVNDLLGHEAGDELLRTVGQRLQHLIRPDDLVARVGGDEFVVLALGITDRSAGVALCERIDATLAGPYALHAGPVRVTASVGLAVADAESTVTGLLADADVAMYDAKAGRRGEPVRSLPERQRNANQRRRLADDLAAGLQRGEVVAHLQPIADLATRRTLAVEALARWNHPELGTLGPASFLDLAEDAGLDLVLGDVILDSACSAMRNLPGHLRLCVNLSVTQLADRGLRGRIELILARHGIPPSRLNVEITEHATLARRPGGGRVSPEQTLLELREMGASLSLDDFGTGYSSLTHIRRYPLKAIKIDRSFVAGVADHPEDRAVIAAVVGLADMLGLQVVGEGVETEEQLRHLQQLGCRAAQGHLICHPLPAHELELWLNERADDWSIVGERERITA